jgi:hypothetical protein
MYPRNSFLITRFPVNVGDKISASVAYIGKNVFKLVIKNLTRNVYTEIPSSYTTMKALRTTAEWIVEAPFYQGILPLANFNTIHIFNCNTKINSLKGGIRNPNWDHLKINMTTSSGELKARTTKLSKDGKSFKVIWKHH